MDHHTRKNGNFWLSDRETQCWHMYSEVRVFRQHITKLVDLFHSIHSKNCFMRGWAFILKEFWCFTDASCRRVFIEQYRRLLSDLSCQLSCDVLSVQWSSRRANKSLELISKINKCGSNKYQKTDTSILSSHFPLFYWNKNMNDKLLFTFAQVTVVQVKHQNFRHDKDKIKESQTPR